MKKILFSNLLITSIILVIINRCYARFSYTVCDESHLKASINWINVSNCNPNIDERCTFRRGNNVTITTSFTSHEPTAGLKVKIVGTVLGLPVPWRVNPDNACLHGIVCPIQNNTENVFTLSMPISRSYPSVAVTVKLRLEDIRRTPYYCILIPAHIDD